MNNIILCSKKHLKCKWYHFPEGWIEACIEWLFEEHKDNINTISNDKWCDLIEQQWLFTDLRDFDTSSSLNILSNNFMTFNGICCFQIMSYRNVSKSFYSQIREIKGTVNENSSVSADITNTNNFNNKASTSTLLLTLTDSVNEIEAFEYEPWSNVNINNISVGCKCRLKGPFIIRKKLAFLKKENIELLGGAVEDLSGKTQLSIVEELLEQNIRRRTSIDRPLKRETKLQKIEPVIKCKVPAVAPKPEYVRSLPTIQVPIFPEANLNRAPSDSFNSHQLPSTTNSYSMETVATNNYNHFDKDNDDDDDDCFDDISLDDSDWSMIKQEQSRQNQEAISLANNEAARNRYSGGIGGDGISINGALSGQSTRVHSNQVNRKTEDGKKEEVTGDSLRTSPAKVTGELCVATDGAITWAQVKQEDTGATSPMRDGDGSQSRAGNEHTRGGGTCVSLIEVFRELSQPEANSITVKTFSIKAAIMRFISKLRIDTADAAPSRWHLELCLGDGTASVSCLLSDRFISARIGYSAQAVQDMKSSRSLTSSCRQAVQQFQEDIVKQNCGIFVLQVQDGCDKLEVVQFQPIRPAEAAALQTKVLQMCQSL